MSTGKPRAVIVGAGVSELVAAHLLSRAGRQVVVIEEHALPDWDLGWIPPAVLQALGLEGKVKIEAPDPWAVALLPDGGTLELHRDPQQTAASIRRMSPRDAGNWPHFCERMARLASFLEEMYSEAARNPLNLRTALRVRLLGRQGMEDLMRYLPMPVAELLDDWFECEVLKGALAAAGVARIQQGPRSAGTTFRLLHQHVGSPPGVFRPPRSDLRRVLRELQPAIEIRSTAVTKILIRNGHAAGVVLASGEELASDLVVSGASPRRSLLELADPGWLDPELVRAVRNLRARGVVARATLSLERAPELPPSLLAPSLDYLERAYDESKYGRVSRNPYMDARREGEAVQVDMQYAPYRLAEGSWDDARRLELGASAATFAARIAPGVAIQQLSVLAPPDLEAQLGWPEGQADHAELALDQALWARPLPELARYATPIAGLWLCGPATYPGAGITGASGYQCVREILRG